MVPFKRRLSVQGARVWLPLLLLVVMAGGAAPHVVWGQGPLELTQNGVITLGDALVVGDAWLRGQQQGEPCAQPNDARADTDGDGCVGVGDVQRLLAHWGSVTAPEGLSRARPTGGGGTFTVDSPEDTPDLLPGDGLCATLLGQCTLRAALQESNVLPGAEQIGFDIRGEDNSCPALVTILLSDALLIDDVYQDGVTVDGYTQCGASANTLDVGSDAVLKIELVGEGRQAFHGLSIHSPHNVIRGLALYDFDSALRLAGAATHNHIEGNFIGTNIANDFRQEPQPIGEGDGVHIRYGAYFNILGCGSFDVGDVYHPCESQGDFNAARNVISGNSSEGIHIEGDVKWTHIVGNYVGLNKNGHSGLRNNSDGIDFNYGPSYNWVGGLTPGEGNVISNNTGDGVELSHGEEIQFNHVVGNFIGTDAEGSSAVGNIRNGITVEDDVNNNYLYNNLISGNKSNGIRLYILIHEMQIFDNQIGVAVDGVSPLPNGTDENTLGGRYGIHGLGGSQHNLILHNTIAFHPDDGIRLSNWSDTAHGGFAETFYNTISQNSFYANEGLGIHLTSLADPETGELVTANEGLPAPLLSTVWVEQAEGSACAGCLVELFVADKDTVPAPGGDDAGEGRHFVTSGVADAAGTFVIPLDGVEAGTVLTATATNEAGSTSPFGPNRLVAAEAPPLPVFRLRLPLVLDGAE